MAEISLSKIILFNKGYIIQTLNNISNTIYYLKIQTPDNTYVKTVTPTYNNNIIIDIWESMIPQNDVCFTLTDTPQCDPSACDITINQVC